MAQGKKDLLGRLADIGDDAIQRLHDAPGADRALGTLTTMRDRVDELQKRVRGVDELERRLAALERKVEKLSKSGSAGTARRSGKTAGAKTPAAEKKAS
jgi:uncharacterized protein involved in exopolysaccharide biosynthesis